MEDKKEKCEHVPYIEDKMPNGNHEQIPFHVYCEKCNEFLGYVWEK